MIKNDILERLMKGEDPNKIAQEFTDALNSAIKEQEAKKEEVQKKEELQGIIDLFVEWFNKYYDVPFTRSLAADDIIELIEGAEEMTKAFIDMKPFLMKTTTIDSDKMINDVINNLKIGRF